MIRLWITLFCLVVFAFPPRAAAEVGPDVQIPQGGTLRGRFIEEHSMKNPKAPLRSEGHFVLVPGTGVIWSIEKPLPLTLIVTPAGLTQKLGDIRLPSVPATKMPVLARATDMLSSALMGKWQKLEKDFAVTRRATPHGWQAVMICRPGSDIPFKSITADGGQFVNAALVARSDGGTENFAFSDQNISADPPTPAEVAELTQAIAAHP
jgi:hypothetical protein